MVRKSAVMMLSLTIVLCLGHWNTEVSRYIAGVKQSAREAVIAYGDGDLNGARRNGDDALLLRIREEAFMRRVEPVDAVVDRVWHAIPGYNGLEVDVERTYERMKDAPPGTPIRYIYREIEPNVSLADLGNVPIYRGNPHKPMVSFMINVAWGNEFLQPILDTLDAENVKATFFLDGSWLKNNAPLAKAIQARGHELSNHAYSHPDMAGLGRGAQHQQIARTEELLQHTLNVSNRWFAPPSGSYNATTVQVAAGLGLSTVLWTVDTVDWRKPAPNTIIAKIRRDTGPGSLILMHPTASSRDALKGMIDAIRDKGLTFGTVTETLSSKRVPSVEAKGLF